jgi:hypothetical protein
MLQCVKKFLSESSESFSSTVVHNLFLNAAKRFNTSGNCVTTIIGSSSFNTNHCVTIGSSVFLFSALIKKNRNQWRRISRIESINSKCGEERGS